MTQGVDFLNMPGMLVQMPEAMLRPNRNVWTPPGVDTASWMAVCASAFGTLFWWIAGRAVQALSLIHRRELVPRIGWTETIAGFLVMFIGATLFGGMLFGLSSSQRDSEAFRLAAAGGLWALLGALSVIARFRQSRLRKQLSNSQPIAAPVGQ